MAQLHEVEPTAWRVMVKASLCDRDTTFRSGLAMQSLLTGVRLDVRDEGLDARFSVSGASSEEAFVRAMRCWRDTCERHEIPAMVVDHVEVTRVRPPTGFVPALKRCRPLNDGRGQLAMIESEGAMLRAFDAEFPAGSSGRHLRLVERDG